MSYFLNLNLPLWWMFLPLIIAFVPTAKWSKWKAKYYATQYKAENNALQLIRDFKRHKAASETYQAEIKALKSDSVEREALIENLDRKVLELTDSLTLSDRLVKLGDGIEKQLLDKIEQLKSKIELSELAHNETKADLEGLEQQFTEALSVISRTKRATKQWDKIMKEKAVNVVNTVIEAVKQKQAEVVHDALGVARIIKADQGENDNGRHDVLSICNEVSRGVKEQAEAIKKELTNVVDMSELEEGDSIVLRSGDRHEVFSLFTPADKKFFIQIFTKEGSNGRFMRNGRRSDEYLWPSDIVQIIKPAKCYKSNKPCQFNCDGLCKNS